jgi:4-hydroxybutyryl-CoA dehydratase/vinylacetyl-CoA-Delta-isomerase
VLVGACAALTEYNGVANASHIRDKIVEMIHLAETLYSGSIACSYEGHAKASGAWESDILLANCVKQNTTQLVYEICRLAHDMSGGLLVTLPSEKDYRHPKVCKYIDKYLKGVPGVPTEHRLQIFRLIESISGGTALVRLRHSGCNIFRQADLPYEIKLAKKIAGIKE